MKNEFQVGEKVKCFDTTGEYVGKISEIQESGMIEIDGSYFYHPKACRRLKKREPRKEITREMIRYSYNHIGGQLHESDWTRFFKKLEEIIGREIE